MTPWHLNTWKVKIWLSREQKELSKRYKKNIFPCFTIKCSVIDIQKKEKSKKVADLQKQIPECILKKCYSKASSTITADVNLLPFWIIFFLYLVTPRPTLSHWREGKRHLHDINWCVFQEPRKEVGFLRPAEHLVAFKPGAFRLVQNSSTQYATPPLPRLNKVSHITRNEVGL